MTKTMFARSQHELRCGARVVKHEIWIRHPQWTEAKGPVTCWVERNLEQQSGWLARQKISCQLRRRSLWPIESGDGIASLGQRFWGMISREFDATVRVLDSETCQVLRLVSGALQPV